MYKPNEQNAIIYTPADKPRSTLRILGPGMIQMHKSMLYCNCRLKHFSDFSFIYVEAVNKSNFYRECDYVKKKLLWGALIIILCCLIPQKHFLEDGGSVVYKAILYSVTNVREIGGNGIDSEYQEGIRIRILGIEVFDNVK